jgi:S-adenosylhomocysteine hydrolase
MPDFTLSDFVQNHPEALSSLALPRALRAKLEATFNTDAASVLADRATQMPVLAAAAIGLADRCFEGLRVVMVLHYLRDLLYFVSACQDAGLNPARTLMLYKPYPYMEKEWVKRCLSDWGYQVASVEDLARVLPPFLAAGNEEVLVIEDGGYVVPFLHQSLPETLPRVRGAVEQTMRGLWNDQRLQDQGVLRIPVVSVAESEIKRHFEPKGVARALWSNIKELTPNALLDGNTVLIVGYGTIGRAFAQASPGMGMPVLVYDPKVYRRALARHDGFDTVNALADGLGRQNVKLVVGTSGTQSLNAAHLALVQSGTYLASASSDRIEIEVEHLETTCTCTDESDGGQRYTFGDGRAVVLLAEGYPINFYAANSVQNQLIDLVMTQMFLCGCLVARQGRALGTTIDRNAVNRLSDDADIIGEFYRTHFR